jgi:hypothetical protein
LYKNYVIIYIIKILLEAYAMTQQKFMISRKFAVASGEPANCVEVFLRYVRSAEKIKCFSRSEKRVNGAPHDIVIVCISFDNEVDMVLFDATYRDTIDLTNEFFNGYITGVLDSIDAMSLKDYCVPSTVSPPITTARFN